MNKKYRILIIGSGEYFDSTDKNFVPIANELVKRSHAVLFLNWEIPQSSADNVVFYFDSEILKFHFRSLSRVIWNKLNLLKPDIIHVITPRYRNLVVVDMVQKAFDSKIVLHIGDNYKYETERFIRHASLKQKIKYCIGSMVVKHLYPSKWFFYDHNLFTRFLNKISAIDCLPNDMLIEQTRKFSPGHVLVQKINPFVFDHDNLATSDIPRTINPDNTIKLVFAGYIAKYNFSEIEILLSTFRKCIDDGVNADLLLVGKVHPDVPEILNTAILKHQLVGKVFHKGFIKDESDFYNLISGCHIGLIPGEHNLVNAFRFPSKVIPFMCLGIPIIISTAYDLVNELEDNEVVKSQFISPDEIADKVMSLIRNTSLYSDISTRSKTRARQLFRDAQSITDDYVDLYNSIHGCRIEGST